MTTQSSQLAANLVRAILAGAFVAAIAAISLMGEAQTTVRTQGTVASFEASVMPKVGPTWQRPAPVTWSSRFNVRWEARWSSEGKYIV